MARFFSKLKVDKPVVRNSQSEHSALARKLTIADYLFQVDDALVWSDRTNGPEEIYDMESKGPHPGKRDPDLALPQPNYEPERVGFRTERQSLRRLPKTGAIMFTGKTLPRSFYHLER